MEKFGAEIQQPNKAALSPEFSMLRAEFELQAHHPPSGDRIIGALFQALLEEPETSPLVETADGLARQRLGKSNRLGEASASEVAGTLRASICTYLIATNKNFSYEGLDQPENWRPHFKKLNRALGDPVPARIADEQLLLNLTSRRVQTNIPERYTSVELMMQALKDRFKDDVEWLDIGSGIMEGPHQLVHKDRFPLKFETVNDHDTADQELKTKVNRLLRRKSLLQECVCLDVQNVYLPHRQMYDPRVIEWSKGSLRPSEYSDTKFMEKFNALMEQKDEKVHFEWLNILRPKDALAFNRKYPRQKFDFISFITTLHQMHHKERLFMMHWARDKLKPEGVMLVQDFAYLAAPVQAVPVSSNYLRMYTHWHQAGRYKSLVYDRAHPIPGLQEVFRFKDSRCAELSLGAARLAINGSLQPVSELIKQA